MANFVNLAIYAVIGYFLLKNKDKLGSILTGFVPKPVEAPAAPAAKGGGKKARGGGGTAGGGGGAAFSGTHIYKPTGKRCSCTGSKPQQIGCSGKKVTSVRSNCNGCGLYNVEATGIVTFAGSCGCGNEATIKHLGPTHSDGNCCWSISTVTQDGKVGFNQEGPHPTTTSPKPERALGNAGNLTNKKIGMKSVLWKSGSGWHQEVWVDPTGSGSNWKKYATKDFTSWGSSKKSSTPSTSQQIEFRVDCNSAVWNSTEVVEIQPGAAAAYARAYKVKPMRAFNARQSYLGFNTASDLHAPENPICEGIGNRYTVTPEGEIICDDTHRGHRYTGPGTRF